MSTIDFINTSRNVKKNLQENAEIHVPDKSFTYHECSALKN